MTETAAESILADLLTATGWEVSRQVALGAKRVDIVAARADEQMAVEVKLRDWRRAARQAFLNGPYFATTWIAVPRGVARLVDSEWLAAINVGCIEFDADGWHVVHAAAPRRAFP